MPRDEDAPTTASAGPAPIQHYREPRTFSAKAGEDVDEWLTHYERVSPVQQLERRLPTAERCFLFDGHRNGLV